MTQDLIGRVAVVTGAASPIGAVIVDRLAARGAKIVIADVDPAPLAARANGTDIVACPGDLSVVEGADRLVETAMNAFGRIDILVNNAGGGILGPFLGHTPETMRITIDRNLWTCVWCCYRVLPVMVERGYGRIVNMGGDSVRNGLWNHAMYNGAKGGVHGLTTGLAREFAEHDITVNTVAPCIVRTPNVQAGMDAGRPMVRKMIDIIPKQRPAELDEVASIVDYLAGDEARFVTGQVISVNGGSTML